MLPVQPWLAAMNLESTLPRRAPLAATKSTGHSGVRRLMGRGFIAIGVALGGADQIGQPVSVGR